MCLIIKAFFKVLFKVFISFFLQCISGLDACHSKCRTIQFDYTSIYKELPLWNFSLQWSKPLSWLFPSPNLPRLPSAVGEEHPDAGTQLRKHKSRHPKYLIAVATKVYKDAQRSCLTETVFSASFALDLLNQKSTAPKGLEENITVLTIVSGISFLLPV